MKANEKKSNGIKKNVPLKKSGIISRIKGVRFDKGFGKVAAGIGSAGLAVLAIRFVPWKIVGSSLHTALVRIEESFQALQLAEQVV
ncbi:MAG: hypothetical protein ACJ75J_07120 [Cytophagaceae bacterium]